jgi:endonuclease/exonuclease/phosphatase family metal-dependent hydrolase
MRRRRYYARPIRVLTWNLYHGRDFPPDPTLFTWRSRLFRVTERNTTHLQVNRDLLPEFTSILAGSGWDLALLQECPPRWIAALASRCGAEAHVSLTSRNSLPLLRGFLARLNPDLIASNEGGSNTTLVRGRRIVERRELELRRRRLLRLRPERRTMAFSRLHGGLAIANLHATNLAPGEAEAEVIAAAEQAVEWAGGDPLIFGGDFNIRPDPSDVFAELERRYGLSPPTAPSSIDHILVRGLHVVEPPSPWPPERREVHEEGRAIRLSDHAPVAALLQPVADDDPR